MTMLSTIAAAGTTDAGLQREVNEDRFYVDEARGLFIVIDGVGGQAAGGKAADVALCMLRERLERETGPVRERVREAIAVANNEIHRLASTRPEWTGMACVLTVAVVTDGTATIGHVGDTRLYKIRDGRIEKVTRDHSPIGEREDAHEISEIDAMRHPRRNEVYRDVGSEPHAPDDPEFVDVHEMRFDGGDALLLCSDGLSDLVESAAILRIVDAHAGDPHAVVHGLIEAANTAGGKDNVSAVYVENIAEHVAPVAGNMPSKRRSARAALIGTLIAFLLLFAGFLGYRTGYIPALDWPVLASLNPQTQFVGPGESIAAAVSRAQPGTEIVVEPGEYRERVTLTRNIRLVSRVPRGATIRLPATASDTTSDPAVMATGSASGSLVGFRVVGDAQTPLGIGILVEGSGVSIVDVEVSGASTAAVSFARESAGALMGSDIHDNPGAALAISTGARLRITHNVFNRNGLSQNTPAAFTVEEGAVPVLQQNVFLGLRPDAFATDPATRLRLEHDNWFIAHGTSRPADGTSRPADGTSRP
jgi:serine/threonine protein phosphatase PrpC